MSAQQGQGGSSSNSMYRLGDFVYFDNAQATAYSIRKIEELNRTANGNVEAKVLCFYRRSEVPKTLLAQSDKVPWADHETGNGELDSDDEDLEKIRFQQMKEREVFLSRQTETLPATLIRGKCSVTLFSEVETANSYLSRDDAFYYSLVYDPHQKTIQEADQGEIKIGAQYQAIVPPLIGDKDKDERGVGVKDETGIVFPGLEERLWVPTKAPSPETNNGHGEKIAEGCNNRLSDSEIEKFLVIARSVGTFARALDCSSSVKQPSLHMSAAAASRDVTLFHAHNLLHKHNYDLAEAMRALVPTSGPVLCRDQMEDWSASEANLFEEAIEKYGKDFNDIRNDFLPWKSMRNIIEYFFMWKTTDRYVQQKRIKALEAESKLKQVFVPAYTNKTTRLSGPNGEIFIRGKDCDAYPKMPKYSWIQYKKYAKLVPATGAVEDSFVLDKSPLPLTAQRLAQLRPGLIIEPAVPVKPGSGKVRAAFFLRTTPMTRASRILCRKSIRLNHHAKCLGIIIDLKNIKTETFTKAASLNPTAIRKMNTFTPKKRVNMEVVVKRLGLKDLSEQEWLVLTPRDQLPKPEVEFFPRPAKNSDGSYIYERIPPSAQALKAMAAAANEPRLSGPQTQLFKKRAYQEKQAQANDPPAKVPRTDATPEPSTLPPVTVFQKRIATLTRVQGGQKHVISWMDAPDDVFFKASPVVKKMRKKLAVVQLRRAARKPFKKVITVP